MNKLPDKPSELLILAMEDLEKVEKSDHLYTIDMGSWVEHDYYDGKCAVCHAGAVMVGTLGADIKKSYDPSDFDPDTKRKLRAIESIRRGDIDAFLYDLKIENIPEGLKESYYSIHRTHAFYSCFEDSDFYDGYAENLDELSKSNRPEYKAIYRNWITSFIGILQAEGL